MEFCPECRFMVYTRLDEKTNEDFKEETGNEKFLLRNYCKNCGWEGLPQNNEKIVYQRNYQNEFVADKVFKNKYTIYDNTLPRLSKKCINDKCITNIQIENGLMIDNLPEDYQEEDIQKLLSSVSDKIKSYTRVKLTSLCLSINSTSEIEYVKQNIDKEVDGNILTISEYQQPKSEILYIKYDPEDMKYLYMCVNCSTCWEGSGNRKG